MYPEERLLEVIEDLSVEGLIVIIRTILRISHPQRIDVIYRDRTLYDLQLILCRRHLHLLLGAVLFLLFLVLGLLMYLLTHDITVTPVGCVYDLCLLLGTRLL